MAICETDPLFAGIDMAKLGPVGGYWPEDQATLVCPDQTGRMHEIPSYIPHKWAKKVRVLVDEKGTHYLWTGWNNGEGHAKARHGGKVVYLYRFLYTMITGVVLRRWDYVDHTCEHKACLNFDHWEPVPPGVNTARGPGAETQYRPRGGYVETMSRADFDARYGEPLDAIG